MSAKRSVSRLLSGLFLSGVAVGTTLTMLPIQPSVAQTGQGLTIFGGVDSEFRLPYTLRNNSPRNTRAAYFLRVPGTRVEAAVSSLRITYPDAFADRNGSVDPESIKVLRGRGSRGREIPVDEVVWNEESGQIDIYMSEDIPADTSFVIAMTDIRNPDRFGMQRWNLQTESRGDVRARYIGTWELLVAEDMGNR